MGSSFNSVRGPLLVKWAVCYIELYMNQSREPIHLGGKRWQAHVSLYKIESVCGLLSTRKTVVWLPFGDLVHSLIT